MTETAPPSPACDLQITYTAKLTNLEDYRFEELCGAVCGSADGKACEACPSCQQYYLGLTADAKTIRLQSSAAPLEVFSIAKQRERDRDLQFIGQGTSVRCGACLLHRCPLDCCTRLLCGTRLLQRVQLPGKHCCDGSTQGVGQ
jgi:hypothetical protein